MFQMDEFCQGSGGWCLLVSAAVLGLVGLRCVGSLVTGAAMPVAVVPATEMRIRSVGGPIEGGWKLWSNGVVGDLFEVEKKGRITVTVRARGEPAKGICPRAALLVGRDFTREFDVTSTDYEDYQFQVKVPGGPCVIEVAFLNDYADANQNRNLLLAELRVTGARLAEQVPSVKEMTEARIRAHRMGTLIVETTPDAEVEITQLAHQFHFGTALNSKLLDSAKVEPSTREAYVRLVCENFNAAVFENALKWPVVEPERGQLNWAGADCIASFSQQNGLALRGHCLFWANEKRVPRWVRSLSDGELRRAIVKRIHGVLTRYEGIILEYDVNNEMLHHDYFQKRLGARIRGTMFRLAHQINPGAVLYLNDYNILSGACLVQYEAQIADLLSRKVPVGGIGCQAHFRGSTPAPISVMWHLDRLGRFGLPIKITEFDIDTDDEAQRAHDLEDFFRVCFAHPAVEGIMLWGFWEGAHWRPRAALWKRDFTPTPAAEAYRNLVFKEWWTNWQGTADAKGRAVAPVFYGKHRIEVDGMMATVELSRKEGRKTVRLKKK